MLETWNTMNCDISRVHEMCVGDLELSHQMTYEACAFSHSVCCGWVVDKTATYRDPRCTRRGPAKCCVIRQNSRINRICWGSGKYHSVYTWHVYWRHETHWTAIYRESTRCVLGIWNYRIRWLMMFMPFPWCMLWVGRGQNRDISGSETHVPGTS